MARAIIITLKSLLVQTSKKGVFRITFHAITLKNIFFEVQMACTIIITVKSTFQGSNLKECVVCIRLFMSTLKNMHFEIQVARASVSLWKVCLEVQASKNVFSHSFLCNNIKKHIICCSNGPYYHCRCESMFEGSNLKKCYIIVKKI